MKVGVPETLEYAHRPQTANHVVLDWSQLKRAANESGDGDVIFVPGGVKITVPHGEALDLAEVTLASRGGRIHMGRRRDGDLIRLTNGHLRGIQITGPQTERMDWPGYSKGYVSRGANTDGQCTVKRCRVSGFGHAGLTVGRGDTDSTLLVEETALTDCPMGGLGYGIEVAGDLTTRRCYFNNCRHSIAAQGGEGAVWRVEQSRQGPESVLHAFDSHKPGLKKVVFRQNHSQLKSSVTLRLRGSVEEGGEIRNNWFERGSRGDPGDNTTACRIGPAGRFEEEGVDYSDNHHGAEDPREAFPEA